MDYVLCSLCFYSIYFRTRLSFLFHLQMNSTRSTNNLHFSHIIFCRNRNLTLAANEFFFLLQAFLLIFFSELGDKTFFIAVRMEQNIFNKLYEMLVSELGVQCTNAWTRSKICFQRVGTLISVSFQDN